MKRLHLVFPVLLLFLFASCEKTILDPGQDQSVEQQIDVLAELAALRYQQVEIRGGLDQTPFAVPNEGLIDEYTLNEQNLNEAGKQQPNRLAQCLMSVEPDQQQMMQLRRFIRMYSGRNERIITRHRHAYGELLERKEMMRRTLMARFRNGEIDQDEFRAALQALHERFREGMSRIRQHHAEAFTRSYTLLLEQISKVLTEEQWEAFSSCISSE